MASQTTRVYPIRGTLVVGEPMVEREVESKAEAERLVATGGFALSKADAKAASTWEPEADEAPASTKAEEA